MWCPKCKIEYRDGITVCKDCGTELMEGTADDFDVVDVCELKDGQLAKQFMEYLVYSGLDSARKNLDETTGIYTIIVPADMEKKAEKLFRGFILAVEEEKEKKANQEAIQGFSEEDAMMEEEGSEDISEEDLVQDGLANEYADYDWNSEAEGKEVEEISFDRKDDVHITSEDIEEVPADLLYTPAKAYTKKADEYKDMKFSGLTFIIFGILGLLYLILCKLEVIPISYNIFVFCVITALFAAFLIMGIVSMVKSGKIRLQIPEEEAMTEEVTKWLDENLSQDTIDSWLDSDISSVENDLLITAHIRAILTRKYPDLDIAYLEMITEDYFNRNFIEDGSED